MRAITFALLAIATEICRLHPLLGTTQETMAIQTAIFSLIAITLAIMGL